ncbi:major facilitator superfamily domain-containing protein 10-like [Argiope bruennichi]|uniref:major facilitator superfamily domain-containing protein 10-like n=1 Tax=Argiope bruennichi TaxID=94029 RepID=UPI002495A37E|nr:major facilitator superfamily domain-containing protein 10-like [Argiope bruennichi]
MLESGDMQDSKMPASKKETQDKLSSSVYIIFLVVIGDLLGFTVIQTLMPYIFEYYDANEKDYLYHWMKGKIHHFQDLFGVPDEFNKVLFGTFIASVFSALQFLVSPIFGFLSDVYGRKTMLIVSMIGIAISYVIGSISVYFYLFIIARITGGLSQASISLSAAIITDLYSEKNRSKGMALFGIVYTVGFNIGPVIGAVFVSQGVKCSQNFYFLPTIFALIMTIIDIFLLVFCFKESLPKEKRALFVGQGLPKAFQFINPFSLFSFNPVINIRPSEKWTLKKLGLTYFSFLFIYSGLKYSLTFLIHAHFKLTSIQQGKMYLFSALIMILIQCFYVRRIPPGKEIKSATVGVFLTIPAFVLIAISSSVEILYIGLALHAYSSATVVPCLTTIASKFGSTNQKGTVLGIFRSLGSLARTFGPLVSIIAYWSLIPTFSYCIGGLLLIVPLILILNLSKELPTIAEKGN